jgi:hypothetical protein
MLRGGWLARQAQASGRGCGGFPSSLLQARGFTVARDETTTRVLNVVKAFEKVLLCAAFFRSSC